MWSSKLKNSLATGFSKIYPNPDGPTTPSEFLNGLVKVRKLYDQLKELPRLSPEDFARECTENPDLSWSKCWDDSASTLPPDQRKWPYTQLQRQSHWDHEGFLLALGESFGYVPGQGPFVMVVKPQGGIFETSNLGMSDSTIPSSYESKLPPAEIHDLEDSLKRLPPSDATGEDIRCIVSFSYDGAWTTRTYRSLPPGNPFQPLLDRMIHQSLGGAWGEPYKDLEFLGPTP